MWRSAGEQAYWKRIFLKLLVLSTASLTTFHILDVQILVEFQPATSNTTDKHRRGLHNARRIIIPKRSASHERFREALYHWARVATQKDPTCKKKYRELRQRGHGYSRALCSVAKRLLAIACSTLTAQTEFDQKNPTKFAQCA